MLDCLRRPSPRGGSSSFQRLIVDEEAPSAVMTATGLSRDAIYQWKARLLQTMRNLAADFDASPMSESASGLRIVKGAPRR